MLDTVSLGPLAPELLRERVAGTTDPEWFDKTGARTVDEWEKALVCAGLSFGHASTTMDFGCGCGRAARHLRARLAPEQVLIGADVDGEAISWLGRNYPSIRAVKLPDHAPSEIEGQSIDLVVSHSVFTHLPETVAIAWLAELHRIIRPGGTFVVSIHGPKVVREVFNSLIDGGRREDALQFALQFGSYGFKYIQGRSKAEMALPEYYGHGFYNLRYIENVWVPLGFQILAYLPVASLSHQDIIVMSRL